MKTIDERTLILPAAGRGLSVSVLQLMISFLTKDNMKISSELFS